MNKIKVFNNPSFGEMRTIVMNSEPWFVGKDVAEILGYAKARNAISAHVDPEDKKDAPIQGPLGGTQTMTVINESGLYSLILSSKLPTAKKFKRWVTSEVLPAIRKTGGYIAGSQNMTPSELMAKALQVANMTLQQRQIRIENLQRQVEEAQPMVVFGKSVETSKDSILVGQLAKILKQNGIGIGQNRLFGWMRENGYLCKRGENYNMPTQRAMELKLFEVKERTVNNPDGSIRTTRTSKVTGKGQIYFINLFLKKRVS